MTRTRAAAALLVALLPGTFGGIAPAAADPAFDGACGTYYSQDLDPDVPSRRATAFCSCLATQLEAAGLESDAFAFLTRTFSEDLTTFIHDYPKGDAWMESAFAAEHSCKAKTN